MDEVLKLALAGPMTPITPSAEAEVVDDETSDTITH
jgi:hypothetical protein